MRRRAPCLLWRLAPALAALLLAACPTRAPRPIAAAPVSLSPAPVPPGEPYPIASAESLLLIRAYRGGTLGAAGHNHVIAARGLSGTFHVPADPAQASLELVLPVAQFSVDEPQLRTAEHSADFPPEVPESARAGTRRNMLGAALLDATDFPEITIRSSSLELAAGTAVAHLEVTVRGSPHAISVPLHFELAEGVLEVSGQTRLTQTELGLTPFSAFLGALQVQDEMQVSFHLVAHAAGAPRGE